MARWRNLEIRMVHVLDALSDEEDSRLKEKRENELRQFGELIEYVHKQFEEQERREYLIGELRKIFERDGYEGGYGIIRFEGGRRRKKSSVHYTGVK